MDSVLLTLYTRQGCCLCKGLEDRLKSIPLFDLEPSIELEIIDIDGEGVSVSDHVRYHLEVPVMLLKLVGSKKDGSIA